MMGDINTTETDKKLVEFLKDRELSKLARFPTCFMSETNPSPLVFQISTKWYWLPWKQPFQRLL